MATPYRGRFAPSPTGPLHFGSLIAALGSHLQARSSGGEWLVRMEDVDRPREVPGAAAAILRALEAFGFEWDGEVRYQSRRDPAYAEALATLQRLGASYGCACSRKAIQQRIAEEGGLPGIYPGTCRTRHLHRARTVRVDVQGERIGFDDALQGRIEQDLAREVGDFVIRRGDGLFAYQLAVVVDDADQGITEVVRGSDLLASTPRQIHLQRLLGYATPAYLHLPVVLNEDGQKLSKQTHAAPLDPSCPLPALVGALAFLGQRPPDELHEGDLDSLWRWAVEHWDASHIPAVRGLPGR